MKDPTAQFQKDLAEVVNDAAQAGVHPAIVHTVLVGIAQDVLFSIKRSAQLAQQAADAKTAETVLQQKPKTKAPTDDQQLRPTHPPDRP